MPVPMTGIDDFPASFDVPVDATDARDAASVGVPFEALADRTIWLKNRVQGQAISRVVDHSPIYADADWTRSTDDGVLLAIDNGVRKIGIPLHLPDGATLTGVHVYIDPAGSHAGLPSTKPAIQVTRIKVTDNTKTTLGSVTTDGSATVGAYEAPHAISVTGLSSVVDRTIYRYVVELANETGTNALANLAYLGTVVDYTLTTQKSDY
jgi:hypothetical protein